jgi:protein-S-isoprenylcysteine O-methyltransferase Ste14
VRNGLKIVVSSLVGVAFLGLLLFLPAGTLRYWQAWVFVAIFTIATSGPNLYLLATDPAAVERRLRAGRETRPVQRLLVVLLFVLMPVLMAFCAVDHRFGWSPVPTPVILIGDVLVAGGLALSMAVVLQNRYAGANIAVDAGQKVVSTGLYGLVRHPMYTGALIMAVGTPIALDSWWGLVGVVVVVAIFVARILDEEKALAQQLDGYRDYLRHTRFRLVPHVW